MKVVIEGIVERDKDRDPTGGLYLVERIGHQHPHYYFGLRDFIGNLFPFPKEGDRLRITVETVDGG